MPGPNHPHRHGHHRRRRTARRPGGTAHLLGRQCHRTAHRTAVGPHGRHRFPRPGTYGDVNLDRFRFTGGFVQGIFLGNADINLDVIGMVNDSRLFNNIVVSSPWADINNASYRTADGPKSRHRGVRHGAHNGRGYPQHRRARPIPGGRRHPRSGRGPSLRRRSAATLTACEAPGQAGGFTPPERPARPPAAMADTGGETAPPRAIPPSADRGLPPPQPPPP